MKILIIGSNGFIGSNSVTFFSEKKHEVWKCRISNIFECNNFFKIEKKFPDYNYIFKNHKFDICINASGSSGVAFSVDEPFEDFNLNVKNVYLLLDAVRLYNPECNLIHLSSAAVYGNPSKLPISEESKLLPLSPYGHHKLMSEHVVKQFQTLYNLKICTFRIFSAYGPNLKKQLFWDIYQKAGSCFSNKVELFGSGSETRDFIFIDDILEAFSLIIENKCSSFNGEIYNLGSGLEVTIKDAATFFLNLINPNLVLRFNGISKFGDPKFWCADISKLSNLGYKANTNFDKGLIKYYEWILSNKKK